MISIDNSMMAQKIGVKVSYCPHQTKSFELGNTVVLFMLIKRSQRISNRMNLPIILLLRENGSQANIASICLQNEFTTRAKLRKS